MFYSMPENLARIMELIDLLTSLGKILMSNKSWAAYFFNIILCIIIIVVLYS